jgi:serine/threonine protein kinase/cytochrome c-type biogenesis protein CcmH/NrfG
MTTQLLAPGTRVGRYEVVAHLASGGMGEVYRARDVELGRDVALKVMAPRLADRPAAVERFRREARHAAKLSHKNIVTLYDWGQDGATWFLALEFIDGTDLHTHINDKGRLAAQEAWVITIQAARALDHASKRGIIHRDVKPSNFLLARHGRKTRVKLIDLGLSRAADDEDFRVTRDGTTVGTIDYLAPEQARDSAQADARSDIYSLGCTLYHMLAGQPPFPEGGLGERVFKHMQTEPPDVRNVNPDVPDRLWAILRRMLAKQPEDRYQTPAELLDALMSLDAERSARHGGDEGSGPSIPALDGAAPRTTEYPRPSAPPPTRIPDSSSLECVAVDAEHRRAAATQYARAREVLASGELDKRHAYDLLVSSCQLDPGNPVYRRALRRLAQTMRQRQVTWISVQTAADAWDRLQAAKRAQDYRKVLEHGEAALAHSPGDTATQLDMAEAAAALNLRKLQIWLLRQACKQDRRNPEPMKALARACERQKDLTGAIKVWQALRRYRPDDPEPVRKLKALLRLLARAYERQNNRKQARAVWQALLKVRPDDREALRQLSALS